jgi:hypothetical protein
VIELSSGEEEPIYLRSGKAEDPIYLSSAEENESIYLSSGDEEDDDIIDFKPCTFSS